MRRPLRFALAGSALLLGSAFGSADAQPLFGDQVVHMVHGPPLVRSVTVGSIRIRLEHTTLAQVMGALGPGRVVQTGDAGGSLARLCYESADASDPAYLVLESGEMGGGTYITGFEMSRGNALRRDPNLPCAKLRVTANHIVVAPGLELGARQRDLLARFGPAQADSAGFLRYAHEHSWKEPAGHDGAANPPMEEWTEMSTLDLEFRADSLVWVSTWKVTSN